jgi:hypothetical protein
MKGAGPQAGPPQPPPPPPAKTASSVVPPPPAEEKPQPAPQLQKRGGLLAEILAKRKRAAPIGVRTTPRPVHR